MLDPHRCDKLLIYGGAFDPPHRAHVELPAQAAERSGADGVLYVPTGVAPHKAASRTPAEHRVAMLELALRGRPNCAISDVELRRSGPSYMVDTLRQLREELGPDVGLRLLIGADMVAMFYTGWREPERIIELAEPVVMMRPPFDIDGLLTELPAELSGAERRRWRERIVAVDRIDVSSTELREALRAGRYERPPVSTMIDPAVVRYIQAREMYR